MRSISLITKGVVVQQLFWSSRDQLCPLDTRVYRVYYPARAKVGRDALMNVPAGEHSNTAKALLLVPLDLAQDQHASHANILLPLRTRIPSSPSWEVPSLQLSQRLTVHRVFARWSTPIVPRYSLLSDDPTDIEQTGLRNIHESKQPISTGRFIPHLLYFSSPNSVKADCTCASSTSAVV